jgi:cytoskeletal protein RodZ
MKTEIKALPLSLALSFLTLLGACSSVNSAPNSDLPTDENSVILENAEEKGAEAVEGLSPDSTTGEATDDMTEDTATETEATDDMTEDTATETEATDTETAEEVNPTEIILPEGDSAEVETDSEAAEGLPEALPETQPEQ